MRINCYIAAWNAYADDAALWMACRKSHWNMTKPFLLPVRLLGTVIVWTGAGVWLIGHFLRFSTWPHWIYCTRIEGGECMEYVPFGDKFKHVFPPVFFEGERRRVTDRRQQADRRRTPR